MLKKQRVPSDIAKLSPGDLVSVDWCDASIGKSLDTGTSVDMPCSSWGVFIGILGEKSKHIIIAQNNFQYSDGQCDIDYTAIPLQWSVTAKIVVKQYIDQHTVKEMLKSFLRGGGSRSVNHISRQMKVRRHVGLDKASAYP